MDPTELSTTELARAIAERRISASEATQAHLSRIERLNPRLNAVVTLKSERALAEARAADDALARGAPVGPLHGVPFTLKDMHGTEGIPTTLGIRALGEHVPSEDGIVAARLRRAGGILLGKTNMAMSIQTVSELFGRTVNPYDLGRTTGGSSGGAAAAVAARLVPFDVGTDLSGSIRMPSHFCGVFGMKPTPQRIPLTGMLFGPPGAPRADRVLGVAGPMARTVADLGLLFSVLAGPDPGDPDVPPVPTRSVPPREAKTLRILSLPEVSGIRISGALSSAVRHLSERLREAGAHVEEKPLPFSFEELLASFRKLIGASFGSVTAALAPPGSRALVPVPTAAEFVQALADRDAFILKLEAFLAGYDALLCAPCTTVAFPHTERGAPIDVDGVATPSTTVDHPTLLATYTGAPAIVVPAELSTSGLPIGVQCLGKRFGDEELMAVTFAIEKLVGPLPPPRLD